VKAPARLRARWVKVNEGKEVTRAKMQHQEIHPKIKKPPPNFRSSCGSASLDPRQLQWDVCFRGGGNWFSRRNEAVLDKLNFIMVDNRCM
jgi:hypothetical protein